MNCASLISNSSVWFPNEIFWRMSHWRQRRSRFSQQLEYFYHSCLFFNIFQISSFSASSKVKPSRICIKIFQPLMHLLGRINCYWCHLGNPSLTGLFLRGILTFAVILHLSRPQRGTSIWKTDSSITHFQFKWETIDKFGVFILDYTLEESIFEFLTTVCQQDAGQIKNTMTPRYTNLSSDFDNNQTWWHLYAVYRMLSSMATDINKTSFMGTQIINKPYRRQKVPIDFAKQNWGSLVRIHKTIEPLLIIE